MRVKILQGTYDGRRFWRAGQVGEWPKGVPFSPTCVQPLDEDDAPIGGKKGKRQPAAPAPIEDEEDHVI